MTLRTLFAVLALAPALSMTSCGGKESPAAGAESRAAQGGDIADTLSSVPERESLYDGDVTNLLPRYASNLERGSAASVQLARERLGAAGERAVPEIVRVFERALSNDGWMGVVSNCCDALAMTKTRDPRALECLRRALAMPSGIAFTAAAGAMGAIRDASFFEPLAAAFERLEPTQRPVAIKAIAALEGAKSDAFLLSVLKRPDVADAIRASAGEHLAARPIETSAPYLREILDEPPPVGSVAAVALVAARDPKAIVVARAAATDSRSPLVAIAARALAMIGEVDPAFAALKDADATVRLKVGLWALRQAIEGGTLDAETRARVVAAIAARADDPDGWVRIEALRVLALLGEPLPIEKDLADLASDDPIKVSAALDVATDSQVADRRATPILVKKIREAPPSRKRGFAQALGRLRDPAAAPALEEIVLGPSQVSDGIDLVDYAAIQLANLGPDGLDALERCLAKTAAPARRLGIARAMTGCSGAGVATRLRAAMRTLAADPREHVEVRAFALRTTPRRELDDGVVLLKRALESDPDPRIRRLANALLWEMY